MALLTRAMSTGMAVSFSRAWLEAVTETDILPGSKSQMVVVLALPGGCAGECVGGGGF